MAGEVSAITERVRERVRREGIDLRSDRHLAERYVREEVQRSAERALAGPGPLLVDEAGVTRQVLAALTGLGPLQPYLDDPTVEELWINAPDRIFVARDGVSERVPITLTAVEVRDLLERMLHQTGRRVDLSSPFVDASLPDGSRLHAVIPDVTRRHISINIRRFRSGMRTLDDLVRLGTLSAAAAEFLGVAVRAGLNILVTGATHTGKTTLLGALLGACRRDERVVTVEETFELSVPSVDHVAMQCRLPSLEGTGEITLRRLIKESLRMRPDRLVVGEVREAEALDMLIALNAGIPGMCSLHAGSAREALLKLCTLPLLAGRNIDVSFVTPTVASSIDLVVHAELHRDGRRRVVEIIAPTGRVIDGIVEARTLFRAGPSGLEAAGELPTRLEPFERVGVDVRALLLPPGGVAAPKAEEPAAADQDVALADEGNAAEPVAEYAGEPQSAFRPQIGSPTQPPGAAAAPSDVEAEVEVDEEPQTAEPEPEPDLASESVLEAEPERESAAEAEDAPEPESGVESESDLAPEYDSETGHEPDAEPEPELASATEADPEPLTRKPPIGRHAAAQPVVIRLADRRPPPPPAAGFIGWDALR